MSVIEAMRQESPGLVVLLTRAFGEGAIDVVSIDYELAVQAGGNQELHGLEREEGVSFRPRLSRIVTILLQDLGCRDLSTVRAAVYAAGCAEPSADVVGERVVEIARAGHPAHVQSGVPEESQAIALAIELDGVRHLHQTTLVEQEREAVLAGAEALLEKLPELAMTSPLRRKLEHAIGLQRRRIEMDGAEAEAGDSCE